MNEKLLSALSEWRGEVHIGPKRRMTVGQV